MKTLPDFTEEEKQSLLADLRARSYEDNGCLIKRKGRSIGLTYTQTRVGNQAFQTHVLVFHIVKGPIPEGHLVRHQCHRPGCWNPDHLLSGTQKQNMQDYSEKCRQRKLDLIEKYR